MVMHGALAVAAILQAAAVATAPQGTWILKCEVGAPDVASTRMPAVRTFRIGPKLLQEWKPSEQKFGQNLCQIFTCKADPGRLEGTISSASVMLTIKLDAKTRKASWRTVGASGMTRTTGPCAVQAQSSQRPSG